MPTFKSLKTIGVTIGLLVLAPGTETLAQELVPFDPESGPLEGYGIRIGAPPGQAWSVDAMAAGSTVAFYRTIDKPRKQHTSVAGVRTHWIQDCEDHDGCLDEAAKLARAAVDLIEVTRFEYSTEKGDLPTCRRMERVELDRRFGKPLEVHVSGLICSHPDDPRLVFEAALSERFHEGQGPTEEFAGDARSFVSTFEFRPLAVRLVSMVDVGEGSGHIEAANGSLWVHGMTSFHQLDPKQRRSERKLASGSSQFPFVFDSGSIWIAKVSERTLVNIDVSDGSTRKVVDLPSEPHTVKRGFGSLWVTSFKGESVVRVDPESGKVVANVIVGKGSRQIAIGHDHVWVTAQKGKHLVRRIDPTTNSVTGTFDACDDPVAIDRDSKRVWVACRGDRKVVHLDPDTGKVIGVVETAEPPFVIASDESTLWVTHLSPNVTAIDVATMQVIARMPLGRSLYYARAVDGSVWITDEREGLVYEVRRSPDP